MNLSNVLTPSLQHVSVLGAIYPQSPVSFIHKKTSNLQLSIAENPLPPVKEKKKIIIKVNSGLLKTITNLSETRDSSQSPKHPQVPNPQFPSNFKYSAKSRIFTNEPIQKKPIRLLSLPNNIEKEYYNGKIKGTIKQFIRIRGISLEGCMNNNDQNKGSRNISPEIFRKKRKSVNDKDFDYQNGDKKVLKNKVMFDYKALDDERKNEKGKNSRMRMVKKNARYARKVVKIERVDYDTVDQGLQTDDFDKQMDYFD
ncbi:hypothetical protein SteCoe_36274 [Stentor coeruleus]|uniref:Uncharacterized protein n=1 Tax=Stentor coeruleus TaxID=5963 RepID=A0A1R2AQK9_9CILI|nr:hypothetical protein SteCoe_36274 [Stentor coeruleus]